VGGLVLALALAAHTFTELKELNFALEWINEFRVSPIWQCYMHIVTNTQSLGMDLWYDTRCDSKVLRQLL
jgi:hypothetical protein